jgi:hypothetical protein
MADTLTTNLNLTKPEPGAAEDTWGISLNADLDTLDAIFSSSGTQINLNPNQINFADNKKAIFGAGNDLQIYHDGTNSAVQNTTGDLLIYGGNNEVRIRAENTEESIVATPNSSVDLYYNNSKKLATTSTGIDVTGTATFSSTVKTANGSASAPAYSFSADTDSGMFLNGAGYLALTVAGSKQLELGGGIIYTASTGKIRSATNSGTLELSGGGAQVGGQILLSGGASDGNVIFKTSLSSSTATEAMRIDSSQRVGINTSSMSSPLEVRCDSNNRGISIVEQGVGTETWKLGVNTDGDLIFLDSLDTTASVTFQDGTGNIFAGRSSAYGSGKIQSFVDHTANFASSAFVAADSTAMAAGVGGEIGFYGKYSSADDYAFYGGIKGFKENGTASNTACALSFYTRPTATAPQEVMRISSAGNVGIGTSSISSSDRLSVVGGRIRVSQSIAKSGNSLDNGTSSGITINNSNNANGDLAGISMYPTSQYTAAAGLFGVRESQTAAGLSFWTGSNTGSERIRIDASGNLLVNKTSSNEATPGHELLDYGRAVHTVTATTVQVLNRLGNDGSLVSIQKDSSIVGSISVTSSATTYNTSSDARLKDVTGEAKGLEVINKLNPVAYNWKTDNKSDEGLIAQEVEEIVPNSVTKNDDGYYQMDYSKLVTPLIKAVQEQQEQIESLRSEIAKLKRE